ncbi:unnamed protein product [Paramecium sonneborni]|uniref:Uncharacterized protein n=1 Tax=Paramecium sonneborni TaxID=65129 RepID=A0A8S1QFX0_9CILI|nr:unnamed protein product [Paramecium sonneborni]
MTNPWVGRFPFEMKVQKQKKEDVHSPNRSEIDFFNVPSISASVVMQPKTVFEALKALMFRQKENSVSYDEFYSFSRRLYICEDPDQSLRVFRQIAGQQEIIQLEDFFQFLSKDLLKLDLTKMTQFELVIRIALELFQNMCDDDNQLDLKRTVHFIKEELCEDIDFLETIDMFGFVQDLFSGNLVTKISLQDFFQKVGPQIRKALSSIIIRKIQQIVGFKKIQFHTRQTNQFIQNNQVKSDIQKLLQQNFKINFDVEIDEQPKQQQQQQQQKVQQDQIVSLLQQSKPKIRGWLQRLSIKKANKWQLLFLQIDQSTRYLRAVKPESIKIHHLVQNTEFICLLELVTVPTKGVHRKTNSLNSGPQEREPELQRPIQTENASSQINPFSHSFILKEQSQSKITLIKSWDIREIEQIFHEVKTSIDPLQNYSGIVELCQINNEPLEKIRQKFKQLVFKEHLMVLNEGKIHFYTVSLKHCIDLSKMRISNDKDLPFIPSHPFPFQIVIDEKAQVVGSYLKVQKFEQPNKQNKSGMSQINELENENSDKEDQKKGFFDQIYDKFKKKPNLKKNEIRIVFGAESEPKRRQWIFSLNYYKSNQTDLEELLKPSYRSSFQTPIMSQGNYTPSRSFIKSAQHTLPQQPTQQNFFIGGNHTHINVGIFLNDEEDYYNVFQHQNQFQNNTQVQNQIVNQDLGSKKQLTQPNRIHCHTDPNDSPQKEQRLITQPSNGAQITSRQIYSTSSVELWQKFLLAFFRFLIKSKNHQPEEVQEPKIQKLYNRQLKICKQK